MIATIAVIVLVVAILADAGLTIWASRLRGEAGRLVAWRLEDLARREQALDTLRLSLEAAHAERERMWLEERRELLDRIQNPHGAAMRGAAQVVDQAPVTDARVDESYASEHPSEASVAWDVDLEPMPFDLPEQEEAVAPLPDDAPVEALP